MVQIKNPLTIVNQGGPTPPAPAGTGDAKITAYDTTTGIITGENLGSTAGAVYLLDRDTDTWVLQPASSWSASSVTLTTPIDTSVIEGCTSIVIVRDDGFWSTKLMIQGQIAVNATYGIVYRQDPDTRAITKITINDSTDYSALFSTNTYVAVPITLGENTYYRDEIIGFQFGNGFTDTSISNNFLRGCINLRQPLDIPSVVTSIGTNFLYYCYEFNQPLSTPSTVSSINNGFLYGCRSFNQPLSLPSSLTSIRNNFLYQCSAFNQPLTIPSTVTAIGGSFLYQCSAFNQPLTLPSSLTTIAESFLYNCYAFNQPLTLPSTLTSISFQFLYGCYAFNQPLTIPSTVTSIPDSFLYQCSAFNQPLDISHVTTIGGSFLSNCNAFNQPLDTSSLRTIGGNFLYNCSSFNQALNMPLTMTSIGGNFLFGCTSFNQPLTMPSTVTSVGGNFLQNCYAFSSLKTDTTASPTDTNSLSSANTSSKMYAKGITVTGTGASTWITNLPDRSSSPYRKLIDGTA